MNRNQINKIMGWIPSKGDNHPDSLVSRTMNLAAIAIAGEREACAKLMDDMAAQDKHSNYYKVAAAAIRARGNT